MERSHYQIIWLLASGKTVPEASSITGYSTKWIYQLASRYNQSGDEGLGDRRHQNQGQKPLLDDLQLAMQGAKITKYFHWYWRTKFMMAT